MILHREELKLWEEFASSQRSIYDDACDDGVPFAEIPNLDELRNSLNEMVKTFKGKPDYHAVTWQTGKNVSFFIPVEYDGPNESGYYFDVSSCYDNKVAGGGFLSCSILRKSRPRTN